MKLLIDIGNTSAKLAVWNQGEFVHFERLSEPWSSAFARLTAEYPIEKCVLSSVAGADADLDSALAQQGFITVRLSVEQHANQAQPPSPTGGRVGLMAVPQGYGADRLAADFGAISQSPDTPLLVIDAGTCITYDLLLPKSTLDQAQPLPIEGEVAEGRRGSVLSGGVISPGVQLRLKAMHEHTALLPLLEAEPSAPLMGMDTKSCMLSAAVNGVRFEIEGYIRSLLTDYPDLRVYITGGNTFDFPEDISSHITQDPLLLLKGLALL